MWGTAVYSAGNGDAAVRGCRIAQERVFQGSHSLPSTSLKLSSNFQDTRSIGDARRVDGFPKVEMEADCPSVLEAEQQSSEAASEAHASAWAIGVEVSRAGLSSGFGFGGFGKAWLRKSHYERVTDNA